MNILKKALGIGKQGIETVIDKADDYIPGSGGKTKLAFELGCLRVHCEELTDIAAKIIGHSPQQSMRLSNEIKMIEGIIGNIYKDSGIPMPNIQQVHEDLKKEANLKSEQGLLDPNPTPIG